MIDLLPLQFGIPGGMELLVVVLIAVLLFGADKVPKLARSTGEAMGEFQKGREEIEEELEAVKGGSSSSSPQTAVDRAVEQTKRAESEPAGGSTAADTAADEMSKSDDTESTDAEADDNDTDDTAESDGGDDADESVDIADAESKTS